MTATQGIEDELRRAGRILPIVEALVMEQIAGDSRLLAEWEIAKRVVPLAVAESAASAKPRQHAA